MLPYCSFTAWRWWHTHSNLHKIRFGVVSVLIGLFKYSAILAAGGGRVEHISRTPFASCTFYSELDRTASRCGLAFLFEIRSCDRMSCRNKCSAAQLSIVENQRQCRWFQKIFNYAQKKYLSKARKYCKILDRAKTESYSKSKEKYPTAIFNSSGGTTCNRSYNWWAPRFGR